MSGIVMSGIVMSEKLVSHLNRAPSVLGRVVSERLLSHLNRLGELLGESNRFCFIVVVPVMLWIKQMSCQRTESKDVEHVRP